MSAAASITQEEYVSLVTYKSDGTPKPLPVWIVDLGNGTAGFTTWGDSWKAKRIRNNPAVTLQPCDQRGNVREGSEIVEATARMGTPEEFAEVKRLVDEKYGIWVKVVKVVNGVRSAFGKGGQSTSAVIIDLTNSSPGD